MDALASSIVNSQHGPCRLMRGSADTAQGFLLSECLTYRHLWGDKSHKKAPIREDWGF